MMAARQILTLDSNVLVTAFKLDEPYRQECKALLKRLPESFVLSEPSIAYQEVCGTVARKLGKEVARSIKVELDRMIQRRMLVNCDRSFCISSYELCAEYGVYAIDALYLNTAIKRGAVLVSLDKEDFIDRVRQNRHGVEAYHVSEFPY